MAFGDTRSGEVLGLFEAGVKDYLQPVVSFIDAMERYSFVDRQVAAQPGAEFFSVPVILQSVAEAGLAARTGGAAALNIACPGKRFEYPVYSLSVNLGIVIKTGGQGKIADLPAAGTTLEQGEKAEKR
jgi:hypothetical protein